MRVSHKHIRFQLAETFFKIVRRLRWSRTFAIWKRFQVIRRLWRTEFERFLGKPDFSDELVANRGQLLVLLDLLIDVAFEAGGLRLRLLNDGSQTCYLGILQKKYYWLNHFKNIGTFVKSIFESLENYNHCYYLFRTWSFEL